MNRWMTRMTAVALVCLAFAATPALAEDAALRAKADDYQARLRASHVPAWGGIVQVVYETPAHETVFYYRGQGDSTMHTSLYLAAESFRYAVIGDADAKANAIAAIETLEHHLRVTGKTGYIGRYVGPIETPYMLDYLTNDQVRFGAGAYAGTFWLSESSSDQYVGWFYGMGVAHLLLDDEPTRALIRSMVKEVVDELISTGFIIITENGFPTPAAPGLSGSERMAILSTASAILGAPYDSIYAQEFAAGEDTYRLKSVAFFNKYTEYFAFNLKHLNYDAIFRFDADPDRRAFYRSVFGDMSRPYVEWTHNVLFDYVWLRMIEDDPLRDDVSGIVADAIKSLTDFPSPPNTEAFKTIPLLPIDPISQLFVDVQDLLGLGELLGFELQTEDPHEIVNRCPVEFLWQRKPYHLVCTGFFDQHVFPGVDYLLAYWMGRYHGYIDPEPPDDDDDDADDDADDDDADNDDDADDDVVDDDSPPPGDDDADDDADDESGPEGSADGGDDDEGGGCGC